MARCALLTRKRSLVQSQYRPLKAAGQGPGTRPWQLALVRLFRFRERRCPILGADLGSRSWSRPPDGRSLEVRTLAYGETAPALLQHRLQGGKQGQAYAAV